MQGWRTVSSRRRRTPCGRVLGAAALGLWVWSHASRLARSPVPAVGPGNGWPPGPVAARALGPGLDVGWVAPLRPLSDQARDALA